MNRCIDRQGNRFGKFTVIVLAFAVAFVLLRTLVDRSMWYDEAYTYCFVVTSWHEFFATISKLDIGIVFYYVLLRLWSDLFGQSQFALRFFSFAWAMASVVAIYSMARELFSHRVGLIAAALLLVNSFWFQQAQTARVYSMATCFALVSSIAFVRAIRRPAGATWPATYVAVMALLTVSQFAIASGVFIGHCFSFFVMRRRMVTARVAITSAAVVAIVLLITGVVITSVGSTLVHTPYNISLTSIWQHISSLLGRKYAPLVLGILATIGVVGGFGRNRDVLALLIWSITPISFILVLALNDSAALGARYMLGALGPFIVLAAYGLSLLKQRPIFTIALALAFSSECFGINNYFREPWQDFDRRIRVIVHDMRAGDVVIFSPPYLAVRAYVALRYDKLSLPMRSETIPSPLSNAWRTVDQRESQADFGAIPPIRDRTLWIFRIRGDNDKDDACTSKRLPMQRLSNVQISSICVQ